MTPACSACGSGERFVSVPTGEHHNGARLVCHGCLHEALKRVGPPSATLHTRACCGPHRHDDVTDHEARYRVVAVWPPQSFGGPPYQLACAPHLREALAAITPEPTIAEATTS